MSEESKERSPQKLVMSRRDHPKGSAAAKTLESARMTWLGARKIRASPRTTPDARPGGDRGRGRGRGRAQAWANNCNLARSASIAGLASPAI